MELKELIDEVFFMVSKAGRIRRILEREDFPEIFRLAPNEHRETLKHHVIAVNYRGVKDWYHDHKVKDLIEMTHKELLARAQKLSVYNYSRLNRTELIFEIRRKENDKARDVERDQHDACDNGVSN